MTWIIDAVRNAGPLPAYLIISVLVFAEDAFFIGFILPGETAAVLGGVLASQHHLQLWLVLVLVIAAAIGGDTVGYQIPVVLGAFLARNHRLSFRFCADVLPCRRKI